MKIKRIGVDLAKPVFQVHRIDKDERVAIKRQLQRHQKPAFFGKTEHCLIGAEAPITGRTNQ